MKSCLHCQGQNRDQARFCGHCGSSFPFSESLIVSNSRDEKNVKPRAGFRAGVITGAVLFLFCQLLWAEAWSAFQQFLAPKDIPENRKAAAERYQAVEKLEERFAESVRAQAEEMPTGLHEMFFTRITQNIRIEKLKSIQLELLVKHFTAQELDLLKSFYETPEGVALQKKITQLEDEFRPQVEVEALHALQETLQELQAPPKKSSSAKDT